MSGYDWIGEALQHATECEDYIRGQIERLYRVIDTGRTECGVHPLGEEHVGYYDGCDRWVATGEDWFAAVRRLCASALLGETRWGRDGESDAYQALCYECPALWSEIGSGECADLDELKKTVGEDWPQVAEFLRVEATQ